MPETHLTIGLLINPYAGVGGSAALKGSDAPEARELAAEQLAVGDSRAAQRVERALEPLLVAGIPVRWLCAPSVMGEQLLSSHGVAYEVVGRDSGLATTADDTRALADGLRQAGADILLFAGGDGTARDVFDAVGDEFPVLGVPAGVKMHSGVFAVSPEAAGELLLRLARAGLVDLAAQEVRDIDEEAFRQDRVKTRFYGDMLVPAEGHYLQHTKIAGRESVELVAAEIAAGVVESMDEEVLYIIGPGSTTGAIMEELGLPNTLLGVDVVRGGQLVASDVDEDLLLALLEKHAGKAKVFVTAIGGQGHILGRGNQQISPAVLRMVGLDNLFIVAAKSKITALEGRPLLVDSNDPALDAQLAGYRSVITGYQDQVLYPVAGGA